MVKMETPRSATYGFSAASRTSPSGLFGSAAQPTRSATSNSAYIRPRSSAPLTSHAVFPFHLPRRISSDSAPSGGATPKDLCNAAAPRGSGSTRHDQRFSASRLQVVGLCDGDAPGLQGGDKLVRPVPGGKAGGVVGHYGDRQLRRGVLNAPLRGCQRQVDRHQENIKER